MPINLSVKQQVVEINKQGYYFIHIKWSSGFKHIVPVRGYTLESELAFNDRLVYAKTTKVEEVTENKWEKFYWKGK